MPGRIVEHDPKIAATVRLVIGVIRSQAAQRGPATYDESDSTLQLVLKHIVVNTFGLDEVARNA